MKDNEAMEPTWRQIVDRWTARMRAKGHDPATMVAEVRAVAAKPGDFHVNDPERGAWWQRYALAKYPVINWDHTIGGLVMGGGGYAVSRTSVDFPYVASGAKDTAQMLARHRGEPDAMAAVMILASNEGRGWSGPRPYHMRMLVHMASARLRADGTGLRAGGNQGAFLLKQTQLDDSIMWEDVVDSLADEHSANLDAWCPVWFSTWRQGEKAYHRVGEQEISDGWSGSVGRMMSGMWGEEEEADEPTETSARTRAAPIATWSDIYTSGQQMVDAHRLVGEAIAALGRDPDRYGTASGLINMSEIRLRTPGGKPKKGVTPRINVSREPFPVDAPDAPVSIALQPVDGALSDADLAGMRSFLEALDTSVATMEREIAEGRDPYALDLSDYDVEPLVMRLLRHFGAKGERALSVERDKYGLGGGKLAQRAWARIPEEEARDFRHERERPSRLKVEIEGRTIRCVKSTVVCPVHGSIRIVRKDGVTTVQVPTAVPASTGQELAEVLASPVLDGLAGVLVAADTGYDDTTMWNDGTVITVKDATTPGERA